MITLESKMKKAEEAMNDADMIVAAMSVYAELRNVSSDDIKVMISENETEMKMFQKFFTATVVSMVCDKANKIDNNNKIGLIASPYTA